MKDKNWAGDIGLILYDQSKKEEFEKIIGSLIKHYHTKIFATKKNSFACGISFKKDRFVIMSINAKLFNTYSSFDSFLLDLAHNMENEKVGYVLGHSSLSGWWADYDGESKESFL